MIRHGGPDGSPKSGRILSKKTTNVFYDIRETNDLLDTKSDLDHDHFEAHYTKAEVDALLLSAGGSASIAQTTVTSSRRPTRARSR
jgi:hypothetical protein